TQLASQSVEPPRHETPHCPCEHTSSPAHATPHAPQFSGSFSVFPHPPDELLVTVPWAQPPQQSATTTRIMAHKTPCWRRSTSLYLSAVIIRGSRRLGVCAVKRDVAPPHSTLRPPGKHIK